MDSFKLRKNSLVKRLEREFYMTEQLKDNNKKKELCDEWKNRMDINPITKENMHPQSTIFNYWVNQCLNPDNFVFHQTTTNKYVINFNGVEYPVPSVINNKWVLGKVLGKGGFGFVTECTLINDVTSTQLAIKIEHINSIGLSNEIKFYKQYNPNNNVEFLPKIAETGTIGNLGYLVMEKLEKLDVTKNSLQKILYSLEMLAKNKITHCDIKFDNIMQRKVDEPVLMDFGLARMVNNSPINSVGGTLQFMGRFAHLHFLSAVNDVESLFYELLHFINSRKLIWKINVSEGRDEKAYLREKLRLMNNIDDNDIIKEFKLDENPKLWNFGKHITLLNPQDIPNFNYLRHALN